MTKAEWLALGLAVGWVLGHVGGFFLAWLLLVLMLIVVSAIAVVGWYGTWPLEPHINGGATPVWPTKKNKEKYSK